MKTNMLSAITHSLKQLSMKHQRSETGGEGFLTPGEHPNLFQTCNHAGHNQPGKLNTHMKNQTPLTRSIDPVRNSANQSSLRRGFLLIPVAVALAWLALSPTARAQSQTWASEVDETGVCGLDCD